MSGQSALFSPGFADAREREGEIDMTSARVRENKAINVSLHGGCERARGSAVASAVSRKKQPTRPNLPCLPYSFN